MRSATPRRVTLIVGLAAALFLVLPGNLQARQADQPDRRVEQRTYVFPETGEEIPYGVFLSSKVRSGVSAPLVVALHGLGGDQNSMIRLGRRTVDFAEDGGYILVTPMGYNSGGWYGIPTNTNSPGQGDVGDDEARVRELSEQDVLAVLDMMREEFNVDDRRTYLMGHSMGGAGTLYLGAKHSSNWAALAAIAPAARRLDPDALLRSMPGMPVMIVQGDMDTAVAVEGVRVWAEKLEELGMTHEYIEIAGGDHGNVIGIGMPGIFEFFAAHSKGSSR